MLWMLFIASCLSLYWIYDGYGRALQLFAWMFGPWLRPAHAAAKFPVPDDESADSHQWLPSITVLLTVYNEQALILDRIRNLLQCNYPQDRLSIVVASDGSTDATEALVESLQHSQVRLFQGTGQGKTATQNAAMSELQSEIVVITDAEAMFDRDFLYQIALPFRDPQVGAVTGHVLFGADPASSTIQSQGAYWRYELRLRTLESRLGVLAVVSGLAFAVRRALLLPMDPAIGEDCIVPLDVVSAGFRVVHATEALAYDTFSSDAGTTLRARIRMTLRNWQGTWSRPRLLNPFLHPGYSFALWSHKLLRWMSPAFLLAAFASAVLLTFSQPGFASCLATAPFAALLALGILGARGSRVPGTGTAFNFLLANLGFLIGLTRALCGGRIFSYRNSGTAT